MRIFLLSLIVLMSSTAFAQTTPFQDKKNQPCDRTVLTKQTFDLKRDVELLVLQDCASVKQESPVGTHCKTSKGFEFVRVENGWTDKLGKTWYDEMKKGVDQYASEKSCSDQGQALPEKGDFELAEIHGIREVFKDMKDLWFWSSTCASNDDAARNFNGNDGYVGGDFRSNYKVYAARCVNL